MARAPGYSPVVFLLWLTLSGHPLCQVSLCIRSAHQLAVVQQSGGSNPVSSCPRDPEVLDVLCTQAASLVESSTQTENASGAAKSRGWWDEVLVCCIGREKNEEYFMEARTDRYHDLKQKKEMLNHVDPFSAQYRPLRRQADRAHKEAKAAHRDLTEYRRAQAERLAGSLQANSLDQLKKAAEGAANIYPEIQQFTQPILACTQGPAQGRVRDLVNLVESEANAVWSKFNGQLAPKGRQVLESHLGYIKKEVRAFSRSRASFVEQTDSARKDFSVETSSAVSSSAVALSGSASSSLNEDVVPNNRFNNAVISAVISAVGGRGELYALGLTLTMGVMSINLALCALVWLLCFVGDVICVLLSPVSALCPFLRWFGDTMY